MPAAARDPAPGPGPVRRAEAAVDLDAIAANVRALKHAAGTAEVLAVVKADAYGHGLIPCAAAARRGRRTWCRRRTACTAPPGSAFPG